jgi:hypothetical protein
MIEEWPVIRLIREHRHRLVRAVCLRQYKTKSSGSLSLGRVSSCKWASELSRTACRSCQGKQSANSVWLCPLRSPRSSRILGTRSSSRHPWARRSITRKVAGVGLGPPSERASAAPCSIVPKNRGGNRRSRWERSTRPCLFPLTLERQYFRRCRGRRNRIAHTLISRTSKSHQAHLRTHRQFIEP